MKKRRRILMFVVSLAALGVFLSVNWSEPHYHLRSISSWLAEYGDGPENYQHSPTADHALHEMGPAAVPYLLKLLHSTNSHSHYTLVSTNYQRGIAPVWQRGASTPLQHVKAWPFNMRHRFQRVTMPPGWDHWKVYLAFQALGPEGKSAIPDLVNLANAPATNSSPSGTGQPPLIDFWKDTKQLSVFVAQSSFYSVKGQYVFPPTPMANVIVFGGGGPASRSFLSDAEIAAWSLAAIGAESVPSLSGMLTNSNPQIRCRAAMALGLMGEPAEPAVPALIKMLDDPDANTRFVAADALGCIGRRPDLVVPALIRAFNDNQTESTALKSLGAFGERATNAVPALLALLRAENSSYDQTRGQYRLGDAALALSRISSEATRKEVIPLLLTRIEEAPSPWSKGMTLETLGQITNQPDLVLPVLLNAIDSSDGYTRSSLIWRLGSFGPAATSAIPVLVSYSTSTDSNLCRLATNTLDKIDPNWRKRR